MSESKAPAIGFESKIRQSPLAFTIKGIAEAVFASWIEKARQIYGLDDLWAFKLKGEKVEASIVTQLDKALQDLVKEKWCERKNKPGWSYGYVCGYVQGALDVEWHNRYILEMSEEYEDLLKLKTMRDYFNVDLEVVQRMGRLYQHYLGTCDVKQLFLPSQEQDVVELANHQRAENVRTHQFGGQLKGLLEELMLSKLQDLQANAKENCCPEMDAYFNVDELKQIVGEAHFVVFDFPQ